ncbi:hypothetical protein EVY06_04100 [Citrobacter koseri]|uniref:Uncharacterized protein n=1 Tax=Citrobacter koseri TaxID=545 RepID=A0AAQ0VBM3_CITKO|nr:hypothetical protein EGS84_23135 [Citrobacter koseri]RZB03055.1 hypothetical protein EVY06_04100 [Citrobacter koseri]TFU39680.1 hypothetical protein E4T98_11995 [Citrobacter koseri]
MIRERQNSKRERGFRRLLAGCIARQQVCEAARKNVPDGGVNALSGLRIYIVCRPDKRSATGHYQPGFASFVGPISKAPSGMTIRR